MKVDTILSHAYAYIKFLNKEKGLSLQRIAEELNKENYRTREGKLYNEFNVIELWNQFEGNTTNNITIEDLIIAIKELYNILKMQHKIDVDSVIKFDFDEDINKLVSQIENLNAYIDHKQAKLTAKTKIILSRITELRLKKWTQ